MNKPIPAYQGDESFMFVCYSHRDSDSVYADINELVEAGFNIWYDEGIEAGKSWRGEIAASIQGASKFIFFISESSLQSPHCLREVDYALSNNVDIIPVYLDDSTLPGELELVLNRVQALFRKTDSIYMERLQKALAGTNELVPLNLLGKSKRNRFGLTAAVVTICLAGLAFWYQQSSDTNEVPQSANIASSANAFDNYLEGIELMERWDQGDNLETSVNLFREAISIDPEFALAYARLADALRMSASLNGDDSLLDDAETYANEGIRLNPGLSPVQTALGKVHSSRGNIDLAYAAIERALTIDPNDPIANQAMAVVFEEQGRLDDAEASFQKAVTLDSESTYLLDLYGNFLYRHSRYEEAAEQWQAVIRIAPDHYGALVNLGAALALLGRTSEEIVMLERAIEIQPTYMAYSNLGTTLGRAQRYQEAVEALLTAISIDDSDWLAWGNLAYNYFWLNGMDAQTRETFEHAIQLAETARQNNSRDAYAHSDLSLYYIMTGNEELALQRLNTALILSPESGEIRLAAAEVYERLGQRDNAVEQILQALNLGFPRQVLQSNPEIANLLEDTRLEDI